MFLGWLLSSTIERELVEGRAEVASVYMQGFVAPNLWRRDENNSLRPDDIRTLVQLVVTAERSSPLKSIRIWSGEGTLLFSTNPALRGIHFESPDIQKAYSGIRTAHIDYEADDNEPLSKNFEYPLFEVYAPLYSPDGNNVIAVGEFYEVADEIINDITTSRIKIWSLLALEAIYLITCLYTIVRFTDITLTQQEFRLKRQVSSARRLATQNRRLRQEAEIARENASSANELLLNQIWIRHS